MRVLGIDPGLTRCGMGVVDGSVGRPLSLVDVNVLRTSSDLPVAQRLVTIEKGVEAWIEEHRPDAVAVERGGVAVAGNEHNPNRRQAR